MLNLRRNPQATCSCGSGETPMPRYDGYGIFLCYTCPRCETRKLSHYRADVFERYDTDESIE